MCVGGYSSSESLDSFLSSRDVHTAICIAFHSLSRPRNLAALVVICCKARSNLKQAPAHSCPFEPEFPNE